INAIGKEIGENILIQYIDYDKLIPTLMAGEIDVIISGMTIIEPRQEVIHFTEPYFEYGEVIIARQGEGKNLVIEDLAGKSIAVQLGTTGQDLLVKLQEKAPQTQITKYLAWEEVLASLESDQVELAIVSHPVFSQYLLENDSKLQMVSGLIASQPLGIAVQKGNQELLDSLNQGLAAIKDNGTYDEIYQKWFLSPGI
ncbi:MAG TPA: transporter substrate-binding domain-containing protein, partial [Syntrophomonadaceae bacterium]|nr:transporter substrate-binding domain-containing protein [Syntrophomonadaceae bacterium]